MVNVLDKSDTTYYECEACGYRYSEKVWIENCEAWCKKHHSCSIDIIANGLPARLRATRGQAEPTAQVGESSSNTEKNYG